MSNNENPVPTSGTPTSEVLSAQLLDAAIELNRFQRGEITEWATVAQRLSNLGLRGYPLSNDDDLRNVADPKTIDIYRRVITKISPGVAKDINDLEERVRKYSRSISSINEPDEVAEIESFLLALHREVLADNYARSDIDSPDGV